MAPELTITVSNGEKTLKLEVYLRPDRGPGGYERFDTRNLGVILGFPNREPEATQPDVALEIGLGPELEDRQSLKDFLGQLLESSASPLRVNARAARIDKIRSLLGRPGADEIDLPLNG